MFSCSLRSRRLASLLFCFCFISPAAADELQAIADAFSHCIKSPASTRPFLRYVYRIPGIGDVETDHRSLDLAANFALTHSRRVSRSRRLTDQLFVIDLRDFADDPTVIVETWDKLAAGDAVFHLPGSGESVAVFSSHLGDAVAVDVSGEGLPERLDKMLAEMTVTTAPVLELRYLCESMLDRHYYAFRGIKVGDELFELLAKRGFYYSVASEVGAVQSNLTLRSKITGDQRIVSAIYGGAGPTPTLITYDLFDENDAPENQLVRNLDDFASIEDGKEIFVPLRNGFLEFILTDGQNRVVAAAPANLALDHTKPDGADKTLTPALSCLACHSRVESAGLYLPIENDFRDLPTVTDEAVSDEFSRALDEPDGVLGRARRDLIFAATPIIGDQSIEGAVGELVRILREYRYDLISPEQASRELGGDVTAIEVDGSRLIDPELYRLIRGRSISRESFDAIRPTLAATLREGAKNAQQIVDDGSGGGSGDGDGGGD